MDINCENKWNNSSGYTWMPLLRQVFVCSGVASFFFIHGLFVGAPTVIIPQLRRETNATDFISLSTESWLSSMVFYSSIPWAIIIPLFAHYYGRKKTEIILCLDTMISSMILYFSKTTTQIFISQIVIGMLPAAHLTISFMVLTEYFSPGYRGLFMTIKSATCYWAIWMSNAIGTYLHWKNIALISFVCSAYTLTTFLWPESPYWLASKGRFSECVRSHRWLKGNDLESEEELRQLIEYHKVRLSKRKETDSSKQRFKRVINEMANETFYKPLILAVLTVCLYQVSGKMAFSIYAISIIKNITVSESMAYNGMLILDGFTVLGMYVGSSLSKFLKRRTLMLCASTTGALFLLLLSLYLYLINFGIVIENKYFSMFLLTAYSISMSCGPIIMSLCISGELTPLRNRSLFLCILCLLFNALMGLVIKGSPYLFKFVELRGSFLFYGISSFIFICILYKYLPETKDKSILEIEQYFKTSNTSEEDNDIMLKQREPIVVEKQDIDVTI